MKMNEYQQAAMKTALYPKDCALAYATLGLAGEAGELANKVKKILRGDDNAMELRQQVIGEMGDVMWYLAALASELDTDLEAVARHNVEKLESRYARDMIKGAGDNR